MSASRHNVPIRLENVGIRPTRLVTGRIMARPVHRLLSYGHDEMLLFTRKRILEREYWVETCDLLCDLEEVLAKGPFQLALLCQSVPDAECQEVTQRVRAAWPDVKVLILRESMVGACSMRSDHTMESLEGPPALLHEIHVLLEIAAAESAAAGDGLVINHIH
jgi:DNA-binding response OmpR family regulator